MRWPHRLLLHSSTSRGLNSSRAPLLLPVAAARMPSTSTTAKSPAKRSTPKKQPPAIIPDTALLAKAAKIASQLQQLYPSPAIPLEHATPFQLLCAVMLSAQTTDKKVCGCRAQLTTPHPRGPTQARTAPLLQVNEVTPELFTLAPDAAAMAAQDIAVVQRIIQPIGLAPTKAKNLVNMSKVAPPWHGASSAFQAFVSPCLSQRPAGSRFYPLARQPPCPRQPSHSTAAHQPLPHTRACALPCVMLLLLRPSAAA